MSNNGESQAEVVEPGTGKEGGLTDEQLLQFSPEQAQQQLNDKQLERYNELKTQDLEEDIEDKKQEERQLASEGLQALREDKEKELTVQIKGIEFLADLNDKQINKLSKFAKYEDKDERSINQFEKENLVSDMLDVLSEISLNHDRSDWEEHFGDAGIITVGSLVYDVLDEIEDLREQKKRR